MADGTLKVGTITNSAGSGNITIGSGVTVNVNRPSFFISLSSDQSVSDAVLTKCNIDTATVDTNSGFDSSNNRWSVPSGAAGLYYLHAVMTCAADTTTNKINNCYIYKNGSSIQLANTDNRNSNGQSNSQAITIITELAASDYLEIFGYINGTNPRFEADGFGTNKPVTYLSGFKIGA
jgi:hypothetical protein